MVGASALVLACYPYFHGQVGDIRFLGPHGTLAIVIVSLVVIALSRGLQSG